MECMWHWKPTRRKDDEMKAFLMYIFYLFEYRNVVVSRGMQCNHGNKTPQSMCMYSTGLSWVIVSSSIGPSTMSVCCSPYCCMFTLLPTFFWVFMRFIVYASTSGDQYKTRWWSIYDCNMAWLGAFVSATDIHKSRNFTTVTTFHHPKISLCLSLNKILLDQYFVYAASHYYKCAP